MIKARFSRVVVHNTFHGSAKRIRPNPGANMSKLDFILAAIMGLVFGLVIGFNF